MSTTQNIVVPVQSPSSVPGINISIPKGIGIVIPMDLWTEVSIQVVDQSTSKVVFSDKVVSKGSRLSYSFDQDLTPGTTYQLIEDYKGKAVPDTFFDLPAYEYKASRQSKIFTPTTTSSASFVRVRTSATATISDLLATVIGDFTGTVHMIDVPPRVDLELTSTNEIPANTPISYASGLSLNFTRDIDQTEFHSPNVVVSSDNIAVKEGQSLPIIDLNSIPLEFGWKHFHNLLILC